MAILDKVTKGKNILKYSYSINPGTEILVDFYNVYCNYINFDKYGKFTLETFEDVLNIILKSSSNQTFFMVSKPIFEVSDSVILNYTLLYKNFVYIKVIDDNQEKSLNKERDDFVCLLLNYYKKDKSFIISNDRFSNLKKIIDNIKPFSLQIFYNGSITTSSFDTEKIDDLKTKLKDLKPDRKPFKFTKY